MKRILIVYVGDVILERNSIMKNKKYIMIGKSLYFPEEKILCIGDIHLGYEEMLHEQGVLFPLEQIKQTIKELSEIIGYVRLNGMKIKKIIVLGDIKHYFPYKKQEKFEIHELLNFLRKYVKEKDIIFIKGNHDKIDIGKKFVNYFVEGDMIFVHGHKDFKRMWEKDIKYIIMGHNHPTVMLKDKYKKERYKCFLEGSYKRKKIIILPSFFSFALGTDMLQTKLHKFIIPHNKLLDFKVYVVNEIGKKALGFGRLKSI